MIDLLASGLGVTSELCLAYIASILGGVAGPVAGIKGVLGERHDVSLPLVLTDGLGSRGRLLQAMFLEPLLRYSDLSRLASKSCHSKVLGSYDREYAECPHPSLRSKLADGLIDMTEKLVMDSGFFAETIGQAAQKRRWLSQIHQPSLVLCSPRPEEFSKMMEDVLDKHALLLDPRGAIIERALRKGRESKRWVAMVEQILGYQGFGSDQLVPIREGDGPGLVTRTRTPFLIHLKEDLFRQASVHEDLSQLLGQGLIVRPAAPGERSVVDYEQVKRAAKRFRSVLKEVIMARRNGGGIVYEVTKPEPQFVKRLEQFWEKLDGVDETIAPFCQGLFHLPYALLWARLLLAGGGLSQVDDTMFHLPVMEAALKLLEQHIVHVRAALDEQRIKAEHNKLADMYRRFERRGPCKIRDVLRSFADQKKAIHQPVLDSLLRIGALRYREENVLETVPEVAPPWEEQLIMESMSLS